MAPLKLACPPHARDEAPGVTKLAGLAGET
jgi:hypothetical protein